MVRACSLSLIRFPQASALYKIVTNIDTLKDLEDTLEQKIEDLDDEISSTEDVKERKALRTKRSEINKTKKSLSDNIDKQVKYKKTIRNIR
ncbi:hypothetical protein ISP04_05800 [Staphylococcus kloosii]|nr:hypothetical protein [Staphylococcus kloosii]